MKEQEMKIAYDSGFVAPFIEMGLISENFEKTAEEKGRAVDTLEAVINMTSDKGTLLKTAHEFGEMQALKDLGLISKKQTEDMQKTASESELKSDLSVVEGVRNYLLKVAAEGENDKETEETGGPGVASRIAGGATGVGAGGIAGGALGALAGGAGGAGLGYLGGKAVGRGRLGDIAGRLGGLAGAGLGASGGGLGGGLAGAGLGALLGKYTGAKDPTRIGRLGIGGGLAGVGLGTLGGLGYGSLAGGEEPVPPMPQGY